MASEEDPSSSQADDQTKQLKKEKKRGPTTAKYITEDDDGPYPLEWDAHGTAVGEHKDKSTTYTGAITRSKVKIHIENWRQVDKELMDRLWVCVKKLFMCDDDKKEFVLRDCNKRWREFKTRLTREYLTQHEKNEEEHPPWKFYPGIDEDDWKLFKELREKPEFKAISEQNRSSQAKNEHPHHLGRGGYEKQEERKIKAQLKNVALSSTPSSSGAEFEMPAIPPKLHYEKWIEGRKEKNGNIPNEKTKEIVEKIYELR